MADTRTIQKALGGAEDLLFGQGTVSQERNATTVVISKINADTIPYSGDDATSNKVSIKDKLNLLFTEDSFVGDGTTTEFTLSSLPNGSTRFVFVNGVYQNKSNYTLVNQTLIISPAIQNGDDLDVLYV